MSSENTAGDWEIFRADMKPHDGLTRLPQAPPWRGGSRAQPKLLEPPPYDLDAERERGAPIVIQADVRHAINAALLLRRPLLVTGKPGVGKSSIAYAVARQLRMGAVIRWPITSRSTVKGGLYDYDAIGRLNAIQSNDANATLGDFVRLGPLGTALYPTTWPRVLLVDEIDKGDLDLPNDLLDVLEEARFEIPELARAKEATTSVRLWGTDQRGSIPAGQVVAEQFPFIVLTSNGEREFPPPFLRRCIRITILQPEEKVLTHIVQSHLRDLASDEQSAVADLVKRFLREREKQELATDQLLAAVFLMTGKLGLASEVEREHVLRILYKALTTT